jgi:phage terminase large subunit-like protein
MVEQDRESAKVFQMLCLAAPPQHGKTKLTECAIIKALKTCHDLSHAYASYSQDVTDRVERETRRIAEAVGLTITGSRTDWWIPETRSRIRWTSVGGSLTGDPVSGMLVVDDPFKDFEQARSPVEREKRWNWLVQVALRRLHPGAWLIEMATRWHEDDLTARLRERMGVEYLNIQAVCEDEGDGSGRAYGEVLWPKERPLEFIALQKQSDQIAFDAQYQGRPRAIGDALFGQAHRFDELPDTRLGFREAYGTDLAYSKSSTADWSVLILGRKIADALYILGVVRRRMDATLFLDVIKAEQLRTDGSVRFYHGGGGELGVCQFFEREVRGLRAIHASADKVVRSTEARKAWNLGRILVPSDGSPFYGEWVKPFLQEVGVFTGIGDAHDDQVDALAALWDELESGSGDTSGRVSGPRQLQRNTNGGLGGF